MKWKEVYIAPETGTGPAVAANRAMVIATCYDLLPDL